MVPRVKKITDKYLNREISADDLLDMIGDKKGQDEKAKLIKAYLDMELSTEKLIILASVL